MNKAVAFRFSLKEGYTSSFFPDYVYVDVIFNNDRYIAISRNTRELKVMELKTIDGRTINFSPRAALASAYRLLDTVYPTAYELVYNLEEDGYDLGESVVIHEALDYEEVPSKFFPV